LNSGVIITELSHSCKLSGRLEMFTKKCTNTELN